MKTMIALAGACALFAAVSISDAMAQGRGVGRGNAPGVSRGLDRGNAPGVSRGLDRADFVAGTRGAHGRATARTRGSHVFGFCPPGQRKKIGRGSRFKC